MAVREAAVAGIGRTPFSKNSGRTPLAMAAEAARAALDDAGLRPADVDGIIDFSTGDSAPGPNVARAVGAVDLGLAMDLQGRPRLSSGQRRDNRLRVTVAKRKKQRQVHVDILLRLKAGDSNYARKSAG
jgi:hypothetical protein